MKVGYARVSSTTQSLDVQIDALTVVGCERIFSEKKSGTTSVGRNELEECIGFVREGDTLLVTRLDRLARSVADLFSIMDRLNAKGVNFACIQQPGMETAGPTGKLMLTVLGAVAAFETDLRRERQAEGIARAKAEGVYKGRKPSVDATRVRELFASGQRPTSIARQLGIGRASVYRAISTMSGEPAGESV